MEDVKEVKEENVEAKQPQVKEAPIKEGAKVDVDTLRFMSLAQLSQMEAYIVKANKEAFDLYFTIQSVKNNKMVIKKKEAESNVAEESKDD